MHSGDFKWTQSDNILLVCLVEPEIEPRASCMSDKCSPTQLDPQPGSALYSQSCFLTGCAEWNDY